MINDKFLDENSNIQFGEGGAGTFSDGKLNTGVSSPLIKTVLKEFVKFGAPKEIEYLAKPHVGSDNLPKVISGLGISIISTNKGIMTNKKAQSQHVGGEVLAYVW